MTPPGQARPSTLCGPLSTVVPADSACLTVGAGVGQAQGCRQRHRLTGVLR